jgi:hypothetical protein
VHERYFRWLYRIAFAPDRGAPLDFGAELWRLDHSLYESADAVRAALVRAGRRTGDDSVVFHVTDSLLRDVVEAAGGVEYAYERFRQAVALAQESYERWAAGLGAEVEPGPEHERDHWYHDSQLEEAWFALEEMVIWARTLDERLRHKAHDKDRYKAQGLIPALADGPRRKAVEAAQSRLLKSHLDEVRQLANLNLHMQPTQTGSRGASVRSGKLVLRFPDPVTGRISHRWELTFDAGRESTTYADGLMAAVDRFMEEMFQAFEQHVPERFKATQDEPPHPTG